MSEEFLCRRMTEADLEAVIPFYLDYYNGCEGAEWTHEKAWRRIHPMLAMENSLCMVLERQGEVLGFVVGFLEQYDDLVAYDLAEIVVARPWQGKGLGSLLLEGTETEVKAHGAAMVQLLAVNDAMHDHFYGKAGYKPCTNLVLKSKWL